MNDLGSKDKNPCCDSEVNNISQQDIQDIVSTITYLKQFLYVPTTNEIINFIQKPVKFDISNFANSQSETSGSNILKIKNGYVALANDDIDILINQRLALIPDLKSKLSMIKPQIQKLIQNQNVLLLGFIPFISSQIFIFTKSAYNLKQQINAINTITYNDDSQILTQTHNKDFQFKLLNLVILKNDHKIYEQLIGKILFESLFFPNYPINSIKGVRFAKEIKLPVYTGKTGILKGLFKNFSYKYRLHN